MQSQFTADWRGLGSSFHNAANTHHARQEHWVLKRPSELFSFTEEKENVRLYVSAVGGWCGAREWF